jgi:hypothetical protein
MRAMDGALLIIALCIAWSFYRAHRSPEFSFNVFDLLMDGGRVSRLACVFLGSFLVSSWIMVRMTLDGKMTELIFAAYGAMWVAPIIGKLFAPAPLREPDATPKVDK